MKNGLKLAFRAVDFLSTALTISGGIAAAGLVIVTVVAVFSRYILGDPIFGIDDVSTMLLSAVVSGSILYGAKVGAPAPAMDCEGFITIVQRGTEWAATGKVTQKVPKSFPGKDKVNLR